jgi:hypothetical protein
MVLIHFGYCWRIGFRSKTAIFSDILTASSHEPTAPNRLAYPCPNSAGCPSCFSSRQSLYATSRFALGDFQLDWQARQATCPQGHRSKSWSATIEKGQPQIVVKFSRKNCRPCPVHTQCTHAQRRNIHLRLFTSWGAIRRTPGGTRA